MSLREEKISCFLRRKHQCLGLRYAMYYFRQVTNFGTSAGKCTSGTRMVLLTIRMLMDERFPRIHTSAGIHPIRSESGKKTRAMRQW